MTNGLYLFLAFLLTWAAFFVYLVHLGRTQSKLVDEIERLDRMEGASSRSAGEDQS